MPTSPGSDEKHRNLDRQLSHWKRVIFVTIAALVLVAGFLAARRLVVGFAVAQPNVILYVVDTLRADHLGVYGYKRETSPAIDAFSRDAVIFERAYSTSGWTRPATASVLTGLIPPRHAAITRSSKINPDVPLLSDYLRRSGYQTTGFVTNVNVLPLWGFDRGFDRYVDVESLTGEKHAGVVHRLVAEHMQTDLREPFLLYLHLLDPHTPYDAPPPFDQRWRTKGIGPIGPADIRELGLDEIVAAYDQEIAYTDQRFGEMLVELEERGLYDDALIVLTSDHGEEFGDHGRYFHGHSLFDELVRVPLIVKLPGNAHAGARVSGPVSVVDIVPTVLGRVAPAPEIDVDGVDLMDAIARGSSDSDRVLMLDLNLLLSKQQRFDSEGVVRGRFKFLRHSRPQTKTALYDLEVDENTNLVEAHAEIARELGERLDQLRVGAVQGFHLWLVGDADTDPRVMGATLRTTGAFADVKCLHGADSGHVRISDDGKTLVVRTSVRTTENTRGKLPRMLVGNDHIRIQVTPTDALITLAEATYEGRPVRAWTGEKRARAQVPFHFDAEAPELTIERLERVFPKTAELSMKVQRGVYVGVVRAATVQMDEVTRERLRALGYFGN